MESLYKRTEKGSELTWEELDTNWTRIKNGVDALEQALQDTRTNKGWILPLYIEGNPESEHTRIDSMFGYGGIIYEDANGFVASYPLGVYGNYNNYNLISNFDISEPSFELSIYSDSPLLGTSILLDSVRALIKNQDVVGFELDSSGGVNRIGFFGEKVERQSITETSSDLAITEIQNILIAYGLAIDNRT